MRAPILLLIAVLAAPALAAPDDEDCPEGKVRNEDTAGHCCWEGQAWSGIYKQCVGLAECPPGMLPSEDGEDCAPLDCADGRVETGEGCCWPGQDWVGRGRCAGAPRCPAGRVARGEDCVEPEPDAPPPPLPPADPLPYVAVGDDAAAQLEPQVFWRGSPPGERGRFRNERRHRVTLTRAVLVKRTEVTRRAWRMLVPHDPSRFAACGLDCPVERVSWYEALLYLNRLSAAEGLPACYRLEGCAGEPGGGCPGEALRCRGAFRCAAVHFVGLDCAGYRLPTEAEWEAAARAGHEGATPAPLGEIAWSAVDGAVDYAGGIDCGERTCGPRPVGLRAPIGGLHDALGNVAEWVWDGFGRYPRRAVVDPVHALGLERGVRGGSFADPPSRLRCALRARMPPDGRNATVGFRWARTLPRHSPPAMLRAPDASIAPRR